MCQVDRLTAPRVATPGPPLRHRSGRDERRAGPPGPFRKPAAILFEPCVGQHEELAHDGDHRDLPRLSLRDELTVLRAQVRFVTDRRQGRHIEQPPRPRPAALDDAAALPGTGLPSHGREACQAGDRLGVEAAEFRHLGQQPRRGDARHARDRRQDLGPASQSLVFGQPLPDQVPEGAYVALARSGGLAVDEGRAVPGVELLLSRIWAWKPNVVVCDPHRVAELHQTVGGRTRVVERAFGGGETTSNIQAARSLLLDSAAGVVASSRDLLGAAFAQTNLTIDGAGNTKMVKARAKRSRDDAAAALLLAAGELARRPAPVALRGAVISREGAVTWL